MLLDFSSLLEKICLQPWQWLTRFFSLSPPPVPKSNLRHVKCERYRYLFFLIWKTIWMCASAFRWASSCRGYHDLELHGIFVFLHPIHQLWWGRSAQRLIIVGLPWLPRAAYPSLYRTMNRKQSRRAKFCHQKVGSPGRRGENMRCTAQVRWVRAPQRWCAPVTVQQRGREFSKQVF